MIALLAILLLITTSLGMAFFSLWRPSSVRFRTRRVPISFYWLAAFIVALAAWALILSLQTRLPLTIILATWGPEAIFPVSPDLLVDHVSWPFALAITSLVVAALLRDASLPGADAQTSDPTQERTPDWWSWASGLALAALGLFAVLAGNLLTVLLAWAALDLVEIIIWLSQANTSRQSEQVVITFSGRLAGIVSLLWGSIVAASQGLPLEFEELTPQIGVYLVIAAGLHMGVLPGNVVLIPRLARLRSLSSLVRLIPAAASLALLGRAAFGADPALAPYLLILIGLAGLYGGLGWAAAKTEVDGQGFWVLCIASLALGAAVVAQPAASLAWGLALLLPGGLVFLSGVNDVISQKRSAPSIWMIGIHLIYLLCISALPFSPTWQSVRLYETQLFDFFNPVLLLFLIAHALLLFGSIRHTLPLLSSFQRTRSSGERWKWGVFPLAPAFLLSTYLWISWWIRPGAPGSLQAQPLWFESWPGIAGSLLGVIFFWWYWQPSRRQNLTTPATRLSQTLSSAARPIIQAPRAQGRRFLAALQALFSLGWLFRFVWALLLTVRRIFLATNQVLESPAGILWALLLLVLLLSLIAQTWI
jgi:hypothetical protein